MTTEIAIDVENVHKTFRIPTNRSLTLRDRVTHPLQQRGFREYPVLRGVSLTVNRGEFFGVVGRNGSGKSTLLKLIASIYRADRGRIRVAGRLSPFIELGVGFHPELAAFDNVLLNGVMMGLSPREARRRYEAVIEFAELEDFTELKLRNYSSGMRVRLAFAVMVQVDADVLLIDEVLAVGDAAFQEKCMETFRDLQGKGKTIVFVTHSMASVAEFCHRAVLIERGLIDTSGDPEEVIARYNTINSERAAESGARARHAMPGPATPDHLANLHQVWVEDPGQRHVTQVPSGEPVRLCAEIEVLRAIEDPHFAFSVSSVRGTRLLAPRSTPVPTLGSLAGGERAVVGVTIPNPFAPGEYELACGLTGGEPDHGRISNVQTVPLVVSGDATDGLLAAEALEVEVQIKGRDDVGAISR